VAEREENGDCHWTGYLDSLPVIKWEYGGYKDVSAQSMEGLSLANWRDQMPSQRSRDRHHWAWLPSPILYHSQLSRTRLGARKWVEFSSLAKYSSMTLSGAPSPLSRPSTSCRRITQPVITRDVSLWTSVTPHEEQTRGSAKETYEWSNAENTNAKSRMSGESVLYMTLVLWSVACFCFVNFTGPLP